MNHAKEEIVKEQTDATATKETPAELNVYADVYKVLLAGMVASTTLFLLAIVRALLLHPVYPLTPESIRQYYHWSAFIAGIKSFDPLVIMMIASLLLILTPVARVIVSIYAFAVDHDYEYVAVTSIVLLLILATIVLGLFGLQ
jgi:uncharacterized membrane protein